MVGELVSGKAHGVPCAYKLCYGENNDMGHIGIFSMMMVGLILYSGCTGPPVEELMRAETEIQIAQAVGADEYASDDFKAAAAALADAKSRTERKDYEGGRAAAIDAFQKAARAKDNVEAGKRSMKEKLDRALASLQDEWTPFDQNLIKKDLTRSQKDALDEIRSIVDEGIKNINGHAQAGDYTGALSLLTQVRENMQKIKETIP